MTDLRRIVLPREFFAFKRYKTLKEGGGAVVSVTSESVDPDNAGKLIHTTGKADTDATLTDSMFGVSSNALKLKRADHSLLTRRVSPHGAGTRDSLGAPLLEPRP